MFTKFVEYAVNILFEEYTEGNPKILKFLKERNLQIKDIDKYNIGYIRENNPIPKFVSDDLKYYTEIQIVQDGRITVSDRIIIPVKDIDGEFCMISCRDAREYGSKTAKKSNQKYLTIKDKGVNKNEVLHGYFDNLRQIRSENEIVVTEGNLDYLTLHICGLVNSVAISGTQFSDYHIMLINNISKSVDIVLALDNDEAGRSAIMKTFLSHPELKERLYFIDYDVAQGTPEERMADPDGEFAKDPDEYVKQFGIDRFIGLKKPINEILNFKNVNDEILFYHKIVNNNKTIDSVIETFYFVESINPDIANSVYIELLKKHLKTFENVGKFCYNAYYHKKRINWFIERFCALWWIVSYYKRVGRYAEFPHKDILFTDRNTAINIDNFNKPELLEEIGEIFEEPIYRDGEFIGIRKQSNYTEKLLKRVAELYIKCNIRWVEKDEEERSRTERQL